MRAKQKEGMCVCLWGGVGVCARARDKWISAMKQHGRHMRHMCIRAAANQNLHLWANHSPIHKVRQRNQIIWARVTKLSLGRHMNTKPQPNDEYILTPGDKSSVGREPTLIWNNFFYFENQLVLWAKKCASRPGSQPKDGRSHHSWHRRWIATCLMCPFAFWECVNTWLMLIINIVHRNSAASKGLSVMLQKSLQSSHIPCKVVYTLADTHHNLEVLYHWGNY